MVKCQLIQGDSIREIKSHSNHSSIINSRAYRSRYEQTNGKTDARNNQEKNETSSLFILLIINN